MTPERFQLIEEIFHGALELRGEKRERFLDAACRRDDDLRRRVEALLKEHDTTSVFLVPPGVHGGAAMTAPVAGRVVGRYRILRLIASGGMGAVYEAEQEKPSRRVALKVLRAGLSSGKAQRRFEFEAQVLASLRHPGIAQIYEAGVHEDLGGAVPFFAMELVDGTTITRHCNETRLDVDGRLRLIARVCEAVHHAHLRGVIHRDIKPSNILVESSSASGRTIEAPKVIDFGIARLIAGDTPTPAPTLGTDAGAVIGTLSYMSPEQFMTNTGASGPAASRMDVRSDVYSLGVVAYELLCGKLPYDIHGASIAETVAIIESRNPLRPSLIDARVRGDIETILLKALEKEPSRRYQSAGELGRDIERYLSFQPIEARPPTAIYHMRMFARRHRAMVAAATTTAVVLLLATATSLTFGLAARREADRAELEARRAQRRADFLQGALASANPWFPPAFPTEDLSDYEPWDEWQHSPWPYSGTIGRSASVTDVVMAAGRRVPDEFADDPATRARLSDTLGWTLQRLLSFERHPSQELMLKRAESLLRDALAIRRDVAGGQHEDTIRSMMRLAEFLDYTPGGVAEGGELYDEAYQTCLGVYGPRDARTLHALRAWVNNQAFLQGKWHAARQRLEETIEWTDTPDYTRASAPVLISVAYYAYLCACMGECDRAREAVAHSTQTLSRLVGAENVRTVFADQYAAQAMMQCAEYVEAERLMRQAIVGQRAFFGDKSLEVAWRMSALGHILQGQQRWNDSVAAYREAFQLFSSIRGPDHSDTIGMQWSLVEALWFSGQHGGECEQLAMLAHQKWSSITSPVDPRALYMAQRMAEGGIISGQHDRTLVFIDQQLRALNDAPAEPAWKMVFGGLRATCLIAGGREAEGRAALDAVIKAARAAGVPDDQILKFEKFQQDLPITPQPPPAGKSLEFGGVIPCPLPFVASSSQFAWRS